MLTKTLRLKHIIFLLLYEALLFLFIVFFLYLEIINLASVSLQTQNRLYKSQCWNVSIKKGFTYKSWWWRSWRRKKKKFEKRDEGIYNSLHWQINWSELLKKTTCQQVIKFFLSTNLICMKWANMCQQTMTTVQQPFQTLKTQPWRKRKRWCHELNSY